MVASSPPRAADLRPAPRVALFASWHRARSAPWGPPFFRHCGPPLRGTGGPWAGRGPRPERCCRFGGPPRAGASAPEDGGLASLPPRIAAVGQPGGPPRRSALLSRPGLGLVGLRGGRGLRGGWLFPGPPAPCRVCPGWRASGPRLAASQPYGGTTAAAWACSHNPRHTRCASKASAAGAHRAPCCRNCLHEHNKGRRKCAAGSCCTVRASPLLPPPAPAAPAGGSRGARGLRPGGSRPRPAFGGPPHGVRLLPHNPGLTFRAACAILFVRGPFRSFGGCPLGIHGRQENRSTERPGGFFMLCWLRCCRPKITDQPPRM